MLDPQPSAIDPSVAPAPAPEVALAWLVFVALLGAALLAIPLAAALIRRTLPAAQRTPIPLEPVAFGHSPLAQRSPRQPVRMHRTLLATALLALPALILLLGVAAVRREGIGSVERALALVVPSLLVTLHARRRSARP